MDKMISADDAFKLANNCKIERIEKEWKDLEKRIQDAAKNGDFDCCYCGRITLENKKKLQELGYKVEIESSYRETTMYISWKKEDKNDDFKRWLIENY